MSYSPERFDALAKELTEHSTAILLAKRQEYAPGSDDRLRNFRQVAAMEERRMSQVAMSYLLKHVQSLVQAANTGRYVWDWTTPSGGEGLKQRIADVINYCYLLAACFDEEAGDR
ncbi:MAG: hypothetical protein IMW98_08460 [Firmicutes bacterium]|nr:hypothetical protein [Bacillota bacterium]MBE3590837.1 hypothetical protein [Bacillota bacterium]